VRDLSCSNIVTSSLLCGETELYESTEYSAVTINETWSQQLIRISQAIGFSTAQLGKQLFVTMGLSEDTENDSDTESDTKKG
jgi:hypothetical protein